MHIVFIGPPGAGKGTQARNVVQRLGIAHVSTGDLLRKAKSDDTELGKTAAQYIDRGNLVPDEVMVDIIGSRLDEPDCQSGWLLDGFPRTVSQAEALDELLSQRGRSLDVVLELDCEDDELISRLSQRAIDEGRADDTPETIAHRQLTYRTETKPVLDYYRRKSLLETVDAMPSRDQVFQDIWRILQSKST